MDAPGDAATYDRVQQILRWVRESHTVLGTTLPELLSQYEDQRTEARRAWAECEALRAQLDELRRENDRLRAAAQAAEHECARLRQEVADVRATGDQWRREQEELVEAFSRFVSETNRLVSEVVERVRPARR